MLPDSSPSELATFPPSEQYKVDLNWYRQLLSTGETPLGLTTWRRSDDRKLIINNVELVCRFALPYTRKICGYIPSDQRNATMIQHVIGVHKVDRHMGISGRRGRGAGAPSKKEKDFRAEWLRRVRAQHETLARGDQVEDDPDDVVMEQAHVDNTEKSNITPKQVDIIDLESDESEEDSFGFV